MRNVHLGPVWRGIDKTIGSKLFGNSLVEAKAGRKLVENVGFVYIGWQAGVINLKRWLI